MDDIEISKDILRCIFDELQEISNPDYATNREDFVFHIIECLDDMRDLREMLSTRSDSKIAAEQMIGILYHMVPHFNAATRLLLDQVPDTFMK